VAQLVAVALRAPHPPAVVETDLDHRLAMRPDLALGRPELGQRAAAAAADVPPGFGPRGLSQQRLHLLLGHPFLDLVIRLPSGWRARGRYPPAEQRQRHQSRQPGKAAARRQAVEGHERYLQEGHGEPLHRVIPRTAGAVTWAPSSAALPLSSGMHHATTPPAPFPELLGGVRFLGPDPLPG